MNNRTLGGIIIGISIIIAALLLSLIGDLSEQRREECKPSEQCQEINTRSEYSHAGVGLTAALFSLGLYLLFFTRSDRAVVERLEREKQEELHERKLDILQRAMDDGESTVFQAIRDSPGITQADLSTVTDLSKAKVSETVRSLEDKNIIRREEAGKTYSLHVINGE